MSCPIDIETEVRLVLDQPERSERLIVGSSQNVNHIHLTSSYSLNVFILPYSCQLLILGLDFRRKHGTSSNKS